jgi:hypothetical protein
MNSVYSNKPIISALAFFLAGTCAHAQVPKPGVDPTPGFNNNIPDAILTPDTVETRIGALKFVDGVPMVETAQAAYDNLDLLRGVEVFLNFMPAASVEALRIGGKQGWACSLHSPRIWKPGCGMALFVPIIHTRTSLRSSSRELSGLFSWVA